MATTTQSNQQNPYASASLYVGDLGPEVTEAILFELFNAVGPVASIRVCRDATTRRSLGYAYVNFHSVQDADRALDTMNFTNIRGRQCRIMWCQRDPQLRKNNKGNIFVRGLHKSIDSKALYDTFSLFGNILSCKVVVDPETGQSRGYGYVHFIDDKSAQKAIEGVNGMKIPETSDAEDSNVVQAELFKSKEEREKNVKFTNVYVKYIPPKLDEKTLTELFTKETGGNITTAQYWIQPFGVSACLNYDSYPNAKAAVEKMNGYDVTEFWDKSGKEEDEKKQDLKINRNENKLYVARAQKRTERSVLLNRKNRGNGGFRSYKARFAGANLYVKNLTPDIDDQKLHQMFSKFGEITSAKVMLDQNNRSRLFGFVAFKSKEHAARAMHEMQNAIVDGKPLYVSRAQAKAVRQQFMLKQIRNKRQRWAPQMMGGGYNQMRQQFQPYNGAQSQGYGGYPRFGVQFGPQLQQNPAPQGAQPRPMNNYPVFQPGIQGAPQIPGIAGPFQNVGQPRPMFPQQPIPTLSFQVPQPIQSFTQPNILRTNVIQQPSATMQPSSGQIYQSVPRNVPVSGSQQAVVAAPPPSGPTGSVHQTQQTSAPASQQSAPMLENQPLTSEMLKTAKPNERKRLIGERLFPKIQVVEPRLAGKITGMLLEMEDTELLILLENPQTLMSKINEALSVLREHTQRQSQSNRNPSSVNRQQGSSQTNIIQSQVPTQPHSQTQQQQH